MVRAAPISNHLAKALVKESKNHDTSTQEKELLSFIAEPTARWDSY